MRSTNAGRIVYDRKPTPFSCRDIRRIAEAIEGRFSLYEKIQDFNCWLKSFETVLRLTVAAAGDDEARLDSIRATYDYYIDTPAGEIGDGGEFGGAGVVREDF